MIMKYKKKILSVLLAAAALTGYAQDSDHIAISNFTLDAGVEQTLQVAQSQRAGIILNNAKGYGGMQFYLQLPDGVSLFERNGTVLRTATDRIKYEGAELDDDFNPVMVTFNIRIEKKGEGYYFFIIHNTENKTITGTSGTPILYIYPIVSDPSAYETGTKQCTITDLKLAAIGGNPEDGTKVSDLSSDCTLRVKAKTGKGGYGSFSWPHALDFTNAGVEAYVAEKDENCIVSLNRVYNVPANTGVIIKGDASTEYYPETTDDGGTATSILTATTNASYTVASDNIYALSTKNGKTAFYRVNKGVDVPLYKAYLTHEATTEAGAEEFLGYDFTTTGIEVVENSAIDSTDDTYHTIDGVRVKQPAKRGIYIHNGNKVVVK